MKKTIFDELPTNKVEVYLQEISNHLSKGYDKKRIFKNLKNMKKEIFEELFSIAKAGLKNKKFRKKMFMNQDDLRFATPEEVAYYRAHRLKCENLVELGSGIGGQTIPFSEVSKNVVAIELDARKSEYAKRNAELHGRKNITFIKGDLLDNKVIKQIKKADIVFFDSERLPEETERSLESVRPDIKELLKKYFKLTENIAIEMPPQIPPEKIPLDCEKEYISFKGQLNRLTLYFGKLKRADRSVVSLPDGYTFLSEQKDILEKDYIDHGKPSNLGNYLIEVSEAVSQARLLEEFARRHNLKFYAKQNRNLFFTSDIVLQNTLVKNYEVLQRTENNTNNIIAALKKHDAGTMILRAPISPDKYWDERKKYEGKLTGKNKLHLFLFNKEAVIAKQL